MNQLDRRAFLKSAGLAASYPFLAANNLLTGQMQTMISRPIPSSSEKIPVVGLGTWQQFDVDTGAAEAAPLLQVLRNVTDRGGRVIDSSPMYGRSEGAVGDLTQKAGLSESFFYATKVWTRGREEGIKQMEESFRKMKRTTMDLMQVHNLIDLQTHLKTLERWKAENKIRYLGATHYATSAHSDLEKLAGSRTVDFLQFNYNISETNAEKTLLPKAMDNGVAVIINEPFASGALFQKVKGRNLPDWAEEWDIASWAQYFLKFILSHPAVTCAIPGTSNPKHALDNMGAGYGKMPDEAGRKKMAAYFAAL